MFRAGKNMAARPLAVKLSNNEIRDEIISNKKKL
jgi:hypothetical protein